jgi:hypothetical protein
MDGCDDVQRKIFQEWAFSVLPGAADDIRPGRRHQTQSTRDMHTQQGGTLLVHSLHSEYVKIAG